MDLSSITFSQVLVTIRDAGVVGLLVLVIVGGYRKWWAWGFLYDQVVKERDEWKDKYLRLLEEKHDAKEPKD